MPDAYCHELQSAADSSTGSRDQKQDTVTQRDEDQDEIVGDEDGTATTDRRTIDSQPTPEPQSDLSHPENSAPTESSLTGGSTIHQATPGTTKRKHAEITSSSDSESSVASAPKRGPATSSKSSKSKTSKSSKPSKSSKSSSAPSSAAPKPEPALKRRPVLESSDEESLPDWSDSDSDSEPDVAPAAQRGPAPTAGGQRTGPASSTAMGRPSQSARRRSSPGAISPRRPGHLNINVRHRRGASGRSAHLAVPNAYRIRPDDDAPPTSTTAREERDPRFQTALREQDERLRTFELERRSGHPGRNYASSHRHMAGGDASASSAVPNAYRIRPDDVAPPTSATFREPRDARFPTS